MKVSIITITYNRAHLIGETIQSVLAQTHSNFEHIIIDDGSTDTTEKVVKSFTDNRIRYFKYKKSGLRSYLRNEGFRKANGGLISLLDSDDLWTPDKLETVCALFDSDSAIDFLIHNIDYFPVNPSIKNVFDVYQSDFFRNIFQDLLSGRILPFSIFTIKKEFLDEIGFMDENLIDGQHDLYLRVAAKVPVYYINKKLAFIRKHGQNTSKNNDLRHYTDYIKSLDKLKSESKIPALQFLKIKWKIKFEILKHSIKTTRF